MRLVGAFLVVLGCLLLAADGTRWDVLLVAPPSGGPGGGKHCLEASESPALLSRWPALWRFGGAEASQRTAPLAAAPRGRQQEISGSRDRS